MWSSLPSNLRAVLGTALLLGIGVAVAAFALSFFALRAAASNPALGWGANHAWLFPIGIDMALVFFEVLLIGASMVRIHDKNGDVVPYPRVIPFALVLAAGAATLYFNAERVPEQVRPVALAVPVASILVTLGLAYLLKMLAAASGVEAIHLAPPTANPRPIVRSSDILHADAVRVPVGEMPTSDRSRTGANRTVGERPGGGERGATTRAIEAVVADLDPTELTEIGDQGVVGLVEERYGLLTTPGYVNKVRRNGAHT
jgi:hypothetical protein